MSASGSPAPAIALADTLQLEGHAAISTLDDAARWLIAGAVAEAKARRKKR